MSPSATRPDGPPSADGAIEPPSTVDFHFDILCPYAYQTSKWIRNVRAENGITINWRFFSLEEVNHVEGKKHPWERDWSYGWSMLRIGVLLGRRDMTLLDRWYETAGRALHEEGRRAHDPEVARALLAAIDADSSLVDESMADPTVDEEIMADHRRVIDAGGYGVPTLFFPTDRGDHCLFGPVLVDPPTGAAALRLWSAVTAWLEFPDLYELQQPKTPVHERRITATFTPYLEARDWVSVNRGIEIDIDADGFHPAGPMADRNNPNRAASS